MGLRLGKFVDAVHSLYVQTTSALRVSEKLAYLFAAV
jgi:hypothetical protein